MKKKQLKYYRFKPDRGTWEVSKVVDGKNTSFGTYKTKKIAKKIVEMMKACDWDKSQLKRVQSELGIVESNKMEEINKDRTCDPTKGCLVCIPIEGQLIRYGDYDEKGNSKTVIELLRKCYWDKSY